MFGVRHKNIYSDPKSIILNSNHNNNLMWLKMGKWVTKCSIETLKLAPCTPGFLLVKENLPPGPGCSIEG